MSLPPGTEFIQQIWQAAAFLAVAGAATNWWQRQTVAKPARIRVEKSIRCGSKIAAE